MRSTPARHRFQLMWQTRQWDQMPDWACKADLAQDEFGRWWVRYYRQAQYGHRRFEEAVGSWSILDPYAWFSPADMGVHPGHGHFRPCRERASLKRMHDMRLFELFHGTLRGGRISRLHTYHPKGSYL